MKKIVVMPGGFHPFHAGHFALYKSAKEAFPDADMYVAASDSRTERPFPFQIKQKLAQVAGVKPNEFVQVKSPFRSEEITAKYNPEEDVLIFVRSEKDKTEQPIPGGTKKDGTPAYFQRYNPKDLKPFKQHGYITYLPTVEFAGGIKSATEIRKQWPHLTARQKANMVQALYPNTTGNKKLIDNVIQLINAGMGELTEGEVINVDFSQRQKAKSKNDWQQVHPEILTLANHWFWTTEEMGSSEAVRNKEHRGELEQQLEDITAILGLNGYSIDYDNSMDNIILTYKDDTKYKLPTDDAYDFTGWAKGSETVNEGDVVKGPWADGDSTSKKPIPARRWPLGSGEEAEHKLSLWAISFMDHSGYYDREGNIENDAYRWLTDTYIISQAKAKELAKLIAKEVKTNQRGFFSKLRFIEGDVVSFKRRPLDKLPPALEDEVLDWWQVKDTEDGKYMKASMMQRGIDVEHKGDMLADFVMIKWREGNRRNRAVLTVDEIMEKLILRAYKNPPPDDDGPSVAEAYDPYDEADVLLRYDPIDKKLKQRSWVHAKLDQAKREGWRYTAEDAMRVHGYFPSKFKQGEFIRKINDKWERVYPYAKKTDEAFAWDKTNEDQYWNVGDGQNEPAAGTQPSEELRLKKSHQYAGAFVNENVERIRKMIKETTDEQKEKTAHLHRKFFEMMEGEVINVNFREPEADKKQIQAKYNQRKRYLLKLEDTLMGIHEELDEMEQLGLLPLHMLDFFHDCKALIKYIQNFKDEDDPLPDDEGNFLESIFRKVKTMQEAWLNRKSHTFESFRNDPILADMPGGDVDTSGPKVLRPQEFKTKRVGPQPSKFWKVTKKQDYLPEK